MSVQYFFSLFQPVGWIHQVPILIVRIHQGVYIRIILLKKGMLIRVRHLP